MIPGIQDSRTSQLALIDQNTFPCMLNLNSKSHDLEAPERNKQ